MNKYSITIERKGYIRTNNDLSGNASFEQNFEIEADTQYEAESIAKSEYLGNCFETFKGSSFNFDWENDSICRDDTHFEIYTNLEELSFENCKKYLDDEFFEYFPIKINENDKEEITKDIFNSFGDNIFKYDLNNDIWNFLDNKYFLGNIRLTIKELNLNNIKPETFFNKDIKNVKILVNEEYLDKNQLIDLLNETMSKSLEYSNDLDR